MIPEAILYTNIVFVVLYSLVQGQCGRKRHYFFFMLKYRMWWASLLDEFRVHFVPSLENLLNCMHVLFFVFNQIENFVFEKHTLLTNCVL
jgi:hypothetical protein